MSAALRLLVAATALLLLLVSGCDRHDSAGRSPAALPPARVRLAPARLESLPGLTEVTGTIRPAHHARLAAKIMGTVADLPVSLGQPVRSGELLVKISAAEIGARVVQARAQLNLAGRDLGRERDLLAKGASTAETVRGLEDRYTQTEAAWQEAETMQGYTDIRAPFDGVIARKFVQAGDLASPGQPLLEVEGRSGFEVEAAVPESLAATLASGTTLAGEADGTAFTGTVSEMSSTADAATRCVDVKLALPADTAVRSGQFVRLQIPGAGVPTLLVPGTAVTRNGQMEYVFLAGTEAQAVLRLVRTGGSRGGGTEILSGLAAGDEVVVNPPAGLREGRLLEVQP